MDGSRGRAALGDSRQAGDGRCRGPGRVLGRHTDQRGAELGCHRAGLVQPRGLEDRPVDAQVVAQAERDPHAGTGVEGTGFTDPVGVGERALVGQERQRASPHYS